MAYTSDGMALRVFKFPIASLLHFRTSDRWHGAFSKIHLKLRLSIICHLLKIDGSTHSFIHLF